MRIIADRGRIVAKGALPPPFACLSAGQTGTGEGEKGLIGCQKGQKNKVRLMPWRSAILFWYCWIDALLLAVLPRAHILFAACDPSPVWRHPQRSRLWSRLLHAPSIIATLVRDILGWNKRMYHDVRCCAGTRQKST
jgi:hypothetical protein